jgi:hypothetical protein
LFALNSAAACAFGAAVMLISSRLSFTADMSPSTSLPPRSDEMESKKREKTSRSVTRSSAVKVFLASTLMI